MKKRILLMTTGGTIVSVKKGEGLQPGSDSALLSLIDEETKRVCDITQKAVFSLDSSNMQPRDWQRIARAVFDVLPFYDGIVITHGTDTLAYTSSMLCFMLRGLTIPVVLTGSQLPMDHPLTDAAVNLRTALAMAQSGIGGVFVAFNQKIIPGCRAVKVRTSGFNAFECINAPLAGFVDSSGLHINHSTVRVPVAEAPTLLDQIDARVFLLKLTPATDPSVLDLLIRSDYHGIMIEAFGIGGIPDSPGCDFAKALGKAAQKVPVIVCSQCLYEPCDFSVYQVGLHALEQGVFPSFDMTTEAIFTKLIWILGRTKELPEVKKLFYTNLAGEISEDLSSETNVAM